MIVVGLTGSIGMGKSTTAAMFAEAGIPVYDADAAVHALYAPGGAAVEPIAQAFPSAIGPGGGVDRPALSTLVLGDAAALARLEAIVHPLLAGERAAFFQRAHDAGAKIVVLDIPLLFETGGAAEADVIVVASAPPEIQRQRALARPGMDEAKLQAVLGRQGADADKRAHAHFVVDTGQGFDHARAQVRTILEELHRREPAADRPAP